MSRIVLLVLCICALAAPVLAQNQQPTRSPDQGFISDWQNEVIFPQAIRFSLTLGMPATGLAAATLTIQPAGQLPIVIDVSIQDTAVVSQPYTELAYFWPIPRDLPPRLFRDITMSWQVTSVNNEIARIQDTFQFTDQRVQWARALDSRLTIAAPADGPDPSRLQQAMQPVYDLLSANTGQSPILQVILYPRTLRPTGCTNNSAGESVAVGPVSGVEVECDPTMADAIFAASGVSAVQSRPGPNGDVEAVATFLTDSFYDPVWQGKDVPAWFRAGLEQYYTPTLKTTLLPLLMEASRNNRLLSPNQLRTLPSSSIDIWYAQSYAMVLYIANQFGISSLYQLAREIGTAESFTDAFESVTQFKYPALLPNVERWLFENSTPSAFAFTPYQASTPTPTPSLSPTPFPPTITPTPTVTPTITATPTVTGAISNTPLPTRTLTPVPTQAPPSVTPRRVTGTELPTPVPLSPPTTPVPLPAPPTPLPVERIPGVAVVIVLAVVIVILMYRRFRPPI